MGNYGRFSAPLKSIVSQCPLTADWSVSCYINPHEKSAPPCDAAYVKILGPLVITVIMRGISKNQARLTQVNVHCNNHTVTAVQNSIKDNHALCLKTPSTTNNNKLAPYGTGGRLILTAKCQLQSHVTQKLGQK